MRRCRWVALLLVLLAPSRPWRRSPRRRPGPRRRRSMRARRQNGRPAAAVPVAAGHARAAGRAPRPCRPRRFPLPACPPLLEAIPDGIQACRCAPNGIGQGAVLGTGPYAGGAATCRAGIHAGAIGPRGGDLVIRVLPLPGEAPGGAPPRHHGAARPARRPRLCGAAGPAGAARLGPPPGPGAGDAQPAAAAACRAGRRRRCRCPCRRRPISAGCSIPAAGRGRPSLGGLAPPVLMPALWRSPTRPADAGAPPAEATPPSLGAPLPAPAPPIPVGGRRRCWGRCG